MSLLGERLRQARETRSISPLQVEIDTRIRANVIQALEEGDFASLPPEPFLRGLIRSYSNYLGVDPQEMLDLYVADFAPAVPPPPTLPPTPPRKAAAPTMPPAPATLPEPIKPSPSKPPPTPTAASAPPPKTPPVEPAKPTPPPALPPETLAPPETLSRAEPAAQPTTIPPFLAHITRRGLPFPAILAIAIAIVLVCLAGTVFAVARLGPAAVSLATAGRTPTRVPATRAPTAQPGATPTNIPTLAVTAAPFVPPADSATATPQAPPPRTPGATTGLNLDVTVTQPITLQVGIDGVMVFNGPMSPGQSSSWTAKNTLYVRVENPKGATLAFNGNPKWFGARNFAELKVMERQWTLNDKGIPLSVAPVAPSAATSTPSALPINPTPTATLTPF